MAVDSVTPQDEESLVQAPQHSLEEIDEKLVWRKNAPFLYDLFATCDLEQSAQSVCWLPDVEGELTKLALGLRSNTSKPSKLQVLILTCVIDNDSTDAPFKSWGIEDVGAMTGFGFKGMSGVPPIQSVEEFTIPSDPNRLAPCPTKASLVAVKGCCGKVFLYDSTTPAGQDACRAILSEEKPAEGYALEWRPSEGHLSHLSTGGLDGLLSIWDVQAKSKVWSMKAHEEGLNDLCHSADGQQLVSVGEDSATSLWDVRSQSRALSFQAGTEQLSVDWNLAESHLLVTGGKDALVKIWDTRKVDAPLKSLKGHPAEVVQVKWCPSRAGDAPGNAPSHHFLASACAGNHAILWDMAADEPNEDGEAPEVVFIHTGHSGPLNDFGLAPKEEFLFCSVAEDETLQLWQPAAGITEEEEPGESAAKRPRIEAET